MVARSQTSTARYFFRFAQDAFTFFDMAFRAAALHGFRFLFVLG